MKNGVVSKGKNVSSEKYFRDSVFLPETNIFNTLYYLRIYKDGNKTDSSDYRRIQFLVLGLLSACGWQT
jgi:hypothetical protein